MSQFTRKAMVHVSGQSVTTLLDGREGNELRDLAQRLKSTLNLTAEQIDDYYDAFLMFPRDSSNKISVSSIQIFYENSDIKLEYEDGAKALHAFTGSRNVNSIDFESFVVNLERWMKKVSQMGPSPHITRLLSSFRRFTMPRC
jgi:Ca2+-binding EF-hand superfamily protein